MACIAGMAEHICEDFVRWHDFDKSARVANHSREGVIELMPIADDSAYSFKYVAARFNRGRNRERY